MTSRPITSTPPPLSLTKKLVYALVINLVVFGMIELTVRVGYAITTGNSYWLSYGKYDRRWGPKYREYLEPHQGYFKFRPSKTHLMSPPELIPTRINNHGFRGKDFEARKAPATLRIITVGESSTFGFHSSDPMTYPNQLEVRLNAGGPCAGRVEVVNAGMPWATSDNLLAMVKGELLDYAPDILTWYAGHNDAVRGTGAVGGA